MKDNHLDKNSLNYSFRIDERFYKRLAKHIQSLKRLNKIQNKQKWIEKAILDRILKEEEQSDIQSFDTEKHLSFKIDSEINDIIEKRVEVIKKIRGSFSKKQWILEAINDKLDLEEIETAQKAKELFQHILKESTKTNIKTC